MLLGNIYLNDVSNWHLIILICVFVKLEKRKLTVGSHFRSQMKVNSSQKIIWKKKKKDLSNITKAKDTNQYIDYTAHILKGCLKWGGIGGYAIDHEHWSLVE